MKCNNVIYIKSVNEIVKKVKQLWGIILQLPFFIYLMDGK